MKIHHIGYLVQDINNAICAFRGGVLVKQPIFDEERLVDIAFVKVGETLIELVAPRAGCSDIGNGIKKLKNTPYHLCFECDCIERTVEELISDGCMLVKEPQPAIAIDGQQVAFLYSAAIGLFEVVEMD